MREQYDATIINDKKELTADRLKELAPDYVFFPHWSYIIPASVHDHFECVVFHMTDLPYGRGGSPLQNLIVRGQTDTKLSALRVGKGIDTGDIYLKKDLNLNGTAEEIFMRAGKVIRTMIDEMIATRPVPEAQVGEPTHFKRRKPAQGNVAELETLEKLYDYIRMLDAEGYPPAFLETEHFRLEFSRASLRKNQLISDVRIIKK